MAEKIRRILRRFKTTMREEGIKGTVSWLWNSILYKLIAHTMYGCVVSPGKNLRWPDFDYYKMDKDEKAGLILKDGRKVFIFSGIPYYDIGGGQRCAQLAKTFNRLGYRVHFYYAFPSGDFKKENYVPIPAVCHMPVAELPLGQFAELVQADDLMIMESPAEAFVPYLAAAKAAGAKVVYENIDNWETSLGSVFTNREALMTIVRESDVLVGTAKLLVEQLHGYCRELGVEKPVLYLANAVDDELFAPLLRYDKPEDMVLGAKTLLYYGSLWGEWFDWDLVYGVARAREDVVVNLIGGHPAPEIMAQAPANVHFLGLKKQIELPAYLKYADFALIPFKTGEIGDYVSPLKIFEYISMGKNVLTTALPDIAGYPNMYSGNDLGSWLEAVDKGGRPDLAAAEAFTAANTWDSRIQEMLDAVYPREADRCNEKFYDKISIVILNYNNKNVVDKCVASLLRCNKRYGYEIVVVDNQSRDGSYEQLQERFGNDIVLVRNSKNGCSSGRNVGVKASKGDYVMFLDSDQWVTGRYWLDSYFEIMEKIPAFGAIGWAAGWFNKKGAAFYTIDSFAYHYMPPVGLCRTDIGYLGTGGMLLRRSLFDEIEGFDEFYDPTCYEDTDLSLKIRHAGGELHLCRSLGVVHLPHQTTASGSEAHRALLTEKQNYFTAKWRELNPRLLTYTKKVSLLSAVIAWLRNRRK